MPAILSVDVTACCVCQRVRTGGPEDFTDQPGILSQQGDNVSHTYCPSCAEKRLGIDRDRFREMTRAGEKAHGDRLDDFTAIIAKARHIAAEVHKGQIRRGGMPYITHVEAVAQRVPPRLKPIALLHDAVEMSGLTFDHLRALGMPEYVVAGVDSLTRRKDETYAEFIERVKLNPDAVDVKRVDIDLNDSDIPNPSMHGRYARARQALDRPAAVAL